MLSRLLDILRCPVCGGAPFALRVLEPPSLDSPDREVEEALLDCPGCGRWFAVRSGIPDLLRDELRETEEETAWLQRHRDRLPARLRDEDGALRPLAPAAELAPEDRHFLDEGRYWGEFMEVYWNAGDRSIFDCRVRATHPSFYGQGVLEVDERDRRRRFGFWSPRLEYALFDSWMDKRAGARALDVGCGGGQYGLEAARRGLDVVGLDPSRRAMELARRHARDTDAAIQYVRGDPADPPFRPGVFDVLMAKDSLHHIADVARVIERLDALLRPGGMVAIHEHVGRAPRKRRILHWLQQRLIPRIQRRYGMVEVPPVLLRESPNEDAGMKAIEPQLRRLYEPVLVYHDLFLDQDAEALAHYAFGKRPWIDAGVRRAFAWLERLLLADGEEPEHLVFIGEKVRAGRAATQRT